MTTFPYPGFCPAIRLSESRARLAASEAITGPSYGDGGSAPRVCVSFEHKLVGVGMEWLRRRKITWVKRRWRRVEEPVAWGVWQGGVAEELGNPRLRRVRSMPSPEPSKDEGRVCRGE